jgi:hypothetical protein
MLRTPAPIGPLRRPRRFDNATRGLDMIRRPSLKRTHVLILLLMLAPGAVGGQEVGKPVDFAGEIYPLLRRACLDCHGKDKQKGQLRLDERRFAVETSGVVVPGNPEESELVRRVSLPPGDDEFMPANGKPLSPAEIERLRAWVLQGARWPEQLEPARHWSYVKPLRPELPQVGAVDWPRSAIDRFVLARLEREGLRPAPEADRMTLIRRLSLDLVGLPPAPAEVDAFLADASPDAVERLVDRLLASPGFGERWARPWLDLARFSDSHGFQRDDLRDLWAYRDWVIQALNADMPFDRFSIEQLAGDLLPGATEAQRIATGFHRCATTNVEAGSIPEETRINQVIDRVNTTATVWLGSTFACAQCHDHKYDPFTQRDYYQLLAFFNSTEIEADRSNPKVPGSIRFLGPAMPLSDPEHDAARRGLQEALDQVKREMAEHQRALANDLEGWASSIAADLDRAPRTTVLTIREFASREGAASQILDDGSVLLSDDPPDEDTYQITVETDLTDIRAFKLEALTDPSLPGRGPGRGDAARPNFVLHTFSVRQAPSGDESQTSPVRLVQAQASFSQAKFDVAGAIDDNPKTGWAIAPRFGEPHWAIFRTEAPVGSSQGTTLTFTLVQQLGGGRTIGRLRLSAITGDPGLDQVPGDVARLVRTPPGDWKAKDRAKLLEFRAARDAKTLACRQQVERLEKERAVLVPATSLVMKELDRPRVTHAFRRGDYRTPGEILQPATPGFLHALPDGPPERNRLALARWLVDRANPLVARVTVNRWWAELFGHGLVASLEDFGVKGEPPTHPELLDWLAAEFMDSGWSMKHVIRTIVLSATYRQASQVAPELLARDDRNRLYARGPRIRMDAEMIRDNALTIAGLLSLKQAGPPIRPFQPDGLWVKIGGEKYDYVPSPGGDRYRRGVYVVWKRAAPYPSFVNFDATERLTCTVRRSRSNTPQQALTLLNDPVYVEAAQAFAGRILAELPHAGLEERLRHAFRLCTARPPDSVELHILRTLYQRQLAASGAEFAAWQAVATALLNLDETITKG